MFLVPERASAFIDAHGQNHRNSVHITRPTIVTCLLLAACAVQTLSSVTPHPGLQIVELNGRTAYNHTGGIDGFSSHLQYYPQNRLTVVVLANTENEPVKKIATEIAALALNAK